MEGNRPADQRYRTTPTLMLRCKNEQMLSRSSLDIQKVDIVTLSPQQTVIEALEMDRSGSPLSQCQDSTENRMHRKRKKFLSATCILNSPASLSNKRRRELVQLLSNTPPHEAGAVVAASREGGSSSRAADPGERKGETHFSSLLSGGLPCFVPPLSTSTETKAVIERDAFSEAQEATSAYISGLVNQSTLTTSSNEEEEESTFLQVASEADTVNKLMRITQNLGIGSLGRRCGENYQNWAKGVSSRTQGEKRKYRTHYHQHHGEVLNPFSKGFSNLSRHLEADRISGSRLRDVSYGDRSEKTEATCVESSGCRSVESERPRRASCGTGSSIRLLHESSELMQSSCSREVHGSTVDRDLCVSSCSDSILSSLVTSYELYQPVESSLLQQSVVTVSERNSALDEILSDRCKDQNSDANPKNSQAVLSSAAEQEREKYPFPLMEHKPSGDDGLEERSAVLSSASDQEPEKFSSPLMEHKSAGDDGLEESSAPTFVLSSGRMSKQEATKLGLRPTTIDDDFDEYFAQLML